MADEYGWSRRHFSRRFIDQVGIAPKSYGSLMRSSAASTALIRTDTPDPGRIAGDFGYYDQSHFHREFHRFAATTPRQLLAMSHSSCTGRDRTT
nr:helix-turn-helix domain-containing protein [Nocardia asiatica]